MAGTVASLLSAGMLALRGRREVRSASAPLNAPSHWLFGRSALHSDHLSLRHTLSGMLIHHGSSIFWALIYSRLLHRQRVQPTLGALLVAALAAWVDLMLVPERLTPGFERRLTHKSLVLVYAAFAFGLSLGGGHGRAVAEAASEEERPLEKHLRAPRLPRDGENQLARFDPG